MSEFSKHNAKEVLEVVESLISEIHELNERGKREWLSYGEYDNVRIKRVKCKFFYRIWNVCDELSIFDWWNDCLSESQLKQMRSFLKTAIKLGFTGYVCFKVGASGCSHGMWAHKKESTNGYSPDGDVLFHSFRSGDNYWDVEINGKWLDDKQENFDVNGRRIRYKFNLKEVKDALKEVA